MRRPVGVLRAARLGVGAALAFVLMVATAYAADPEASFTITPANPVNGERVTFTSTSTDRDNDIESIRWDLDAGSSFNDGSGPTVSRVYTCPSEDPPPCTLNARVRVEDEDENVDTASRNFTVGPNAAPVAAFSASPESPLTNEEVTFTSSSSDPDGRPLTYRWDTDDDGDFNDGTDSQATASFPNDGTRTIRLLVLDSGGRSDTEEKTITVRDPPPKASFEYSPGNPYVGDEVVFTSTSEARGDPIEDEDWDLDGDGQFDDAEGPQASRSFGQPGSYTVRLRVRDDDGGTDEALETIEVVQRPASPPASNPPGGGTSTGTALGPRLISPFPTVRIRGVTTRLGARIDLLGVRTPGGVRILTRCKGGGCPWARRVQRARYSASRVRTVRIQGFKRRHVRAGAVIQIYVTGRGVIGKYTRFVIRKLRAPRRLDACTVPGSARQRRCPG